MSECPLCKKPQTYDPYCCKEKLNRDVDIYNRAMSAYLYEKTDGRFGKKMEHKND